MTDNPHAAFSVFGIEIEYMIVDRDTLNVAPLSDKLLTAAHGELTQETEQGDIAWSNELALHVIEVKTNGPTARLDAAVGNFQAALRHIHQLLAPMNARLMSTGAHPWMDPLRDTQLWPHGDDEIYLAFDRIFGCQGHGWSNLQSMHINLPFADDGEFGKLHAAIRAVLPILPALAASTPFLDGRATGFADARVDTYARNQIRIPSITGRVIPEPVRSRDEYQSVILEPMYRAIRPEDPLGILQFEWLNSRGAIARFDRSAIEIRLIDTQEQPAADLAIAALVIATVERLYRGPAATLDAADAIDTDELARILQSCVQLGERAPIDNADYRRVLGAPDARTGQDVWRALANLSAQKLGPHEDALDVVLGDGTLATRLLRDVGARVDAQSLKKTYARLCDCLAHGRMFRSAA
ncbi:MAG TPA: glutamate-cysteine ligase family protein [Pseudomonadales bacterium]|nr:glutamate-cysteine ligase family protein [Pseudomonadales bacterium]